MEREMMRDKKLMGQISEHFNRVLAEREANAMLFFLPTDGPERIECINPVIATSEQKEKIDTLITEISKNFDIGQGADKNLDEDYDGSAVKPFKTDDS
tara:strand:- start:9741 stop:10034 length:294 start_codon:yes stop_codon:yes gene_type:complete